MISLDAHLEHGPRYRFALNVSVTAAMDGKVVMWNLRMSSGGKYKAPKKVRASPWKSTDIEAFLRVGWSMQTKCFISGCLRNIAHSSEDKVEG